MKRQGKKGTFQIHSTSISVNFEYVFERLVRIISISSGDETNGCVREKSVCIQENP